MSAVAPWGSGADRDGPGHPTAIRSQLREEIIHRLLDVGGHAVGVGRFTERRRAAWNPIPGAKAAPAGAGPGGRAPRPLCQDRSVRVTGP